MRNSKLKLILLAIVLVTIFSCSDNPTEPEISSLNERIQTLVDQTYADYLVENPGFPGGFAVRVIYGDKTGFVHKGFSDNFSQNSHFRGQSTTKTFTAAGIMLLYQRGLLHLNSLVTDTIPGKEIPYLPNTQVFDIPFKDQITIWQLLNHTAGVYDLINHPDGAAFLENIF